MKKFVTMLIVGLMSISMAIAKDSPWREVQAVEMPRTIQIYEGVTRNGNPKCWIELDGVKITVSPTNVAKFKKGETRLEIVKWYNDTTKKYKYSTRQIKSFVPLTNNSKDIDLQKFR